LLLRESLRNSYSVHIVARDDSDIYAAVRRRDASSRGFCQIIDEVGRRQQSFVAAMRIVLQWVSLLAGAASPALSRPAAPSRRQSPDSNSLRALVFPRARCPRSAVRPPRPRKAPRAKHSGSSSRAHVWPSDGRAVVSNFGGRCLSVRNTVRTPAAEYRDYDIRSRPPRSRSARVRRRSV